MLTVNVIVASMKKLIASGLKKSYKGRTVVKNVSLEVKQGEVVGLLGPNGAGKTTSFYMIAGVVRPDSGSIVLDTANITHLAIKKGDWTEDEIVMTRVHSSIYTRVVRAYTQQPIIARLASKATTASRVRSCT